MIEVDRYADRTDGFNFLTRRGFELAVLLGLLRRPSAQEVADANGN